MCLCHRIIVLISVLGAVQAAPNSWPPKLKSYDIWDAPPASGTSRAIRNEEEISQNNEFFEYSSNQTRFRDSRGKYSMEIINNCKSYEAVINLNFF